MGRSLSCFVNVMVLAQGILRVHINKVGFSEMVGVYLIIMAQMEQMALPSPPTLLLFLYSSSELTIISIISFCYLKMKKLGHMLLTIK